MMEKKNNLLRAILIIIAVGVWVIVLQNAGVIPTSQRVIVTNKVDTYIKGGSVSVSGSVDIDNTVDTYITGGLIDTY